MIYFFFLGLYAQKNIVRGLPAKKFVFIRKWAESAARFSLQDRFHQDITLDDIYFFLQKKLKLSNAETKALKEEEVRLELDYCFPRKFGISLYQMAVKARKRVAFISDMYLSKDVLAVLLEKNGLTGPHTIYVSGEYAKSKACGALFFEFIRHEKIKSPSCLLHVGDNPHADVDVPMNLGIHTFGVPSAKSKYVETSPMFTTPMSFYSRCNCALHANKLWDNPFICNTDLPAEDPQRFFGDAWTSSCSTMHYYETDFVKESCWLNILKVYSKLSKWLTV